MVPNEEKRTPEEIEGSETVRISKEALRESFIRIGGSAEQTRRAWEEYMAASQALEEEIQEDSELRSDVSPSPEDT